MLNVAFILDLFHLYCGNLHNAVQLRVITKPSLCNRTFVINFWLCSQNQNVYRPNVIELIRYSRDQRSNPVSNYRYVLIQMINTPKK